MLPDYVLLAVCGVRGLGRLGREHLAVALALEVPLAVVVTKADAAEGQQLEQVLAQIRWGGCRGRRTSTWSYLAACTCLSVHVEHGERKYVVPTLSVLPVVGACKVPPDYVRLAGCQA